MFVTACDFTPAYNKNISVSGTIFCDSAPLDGVVIKSAAQNLMVTSIDGKFNFSITKSSITIYAEKTGYTFSPKSVTVDSDTDDIVFIAKKIVPLDGTLSLSCINITPSSIVSVTDNFQYVQNGDNCLKIKNFNIMVNNKSYNALTKDFYAVKNKSNVIDFPYDISVNTGKAFSIHFSLDAYFISYHSEYEYIEEKKSVLNIMTQQTTADLDSNNQIKYTFVGVNSSNNKFTYNVVFVFDYYPNI